MVKLQYKEGGDRAHVRSTNHKAGVENAAKGSFPFQNKE